MMAMIDTIQPTFASSSLARRIEAAEASLTADVGHVFQRRRDVIVARIGGGVGVFYGDSPFDKVIGLGFETFEPVDLERFERAVAARGGHVQVELSTLADPELAAGLTGRGYSLCGFENVLGRSLEGTNDAMDDAIAVASPDDSATWIATVARASADPDRFDGPASHESFSDDTIAAVLRDMDSLRGFRRFVATIGDEVVGGASMRIHDGIAQLTGAATLAPYRRRGVQRALLRARLALAARAGCELAVVTTQPGSISQHNVMRAGFSLLYSRAILRRANSPAITTRAREAVVPRRACACATTSRRRRTAME